jgi:glycosyltransferase involved in cell wall biosynthesis
MMASTQDLTVIVPVRNGEHWIDDCLSSIVCGSPAEIVVVDGLSTDRTVQIARGHGTRVISDEGRGVAAARHMGAEIARTRYVALIDVDVVLHDGALEELLDEFVADEYTGLQAGLHSIAGPGYWGQALAHHHRSGRSKEWFGLVATILERDVLLEHGLNERFLSGEDIELRWRLKRAEAKIGVSRTTIVEHRFDDTWDFALGQWLADGHGLGRMLGVHGRRSYGLMALPLVAATRGCVLSVVRLQPRWLPYYVCFCAFNYVGMAREILRRMGRGRVVAAGMPA